MPVTPLVDLRTVNIEQVEYDRDAIMDLIPHRYEMLQIDRVVTFRPDEKFTVGIKEVREDEFWVRGHIPGRPILPGVLLIEASAQLGFFHFRMAIDPDPEKFFGFTKVENVKYRGIARPGDMVVLVVKLIKTRRNHAAFAAQCYVEGRIIFEGVIHGASL